MEAMKEKETSSYCARASYLICHLKVRQSSCQLITLALLLSARVGPHGLFLPRWSVMTLSLPGNCIRANRQLG